MVRGDDPEQLIEKIAQNEMIEVVRIFFMDRVCIENRREPLVDNTHRSTDLGLGVDDRNRAVVGANTTMGSISAVDISLVHSNSAPGEAHPVRHAGSEKFPAGRDLMLPGVCVAFDDGTTGVENFPIEVGALVSDLFGNTVFAGRCFVFGAATGDAVVHRDLIIDQKETTLGCEVNTNGSVSRVGLGQEGAVFPGPGCAGVGVELEVFV